MVVEGESCGTSVTNDWVTPDPANVVRLLDSDIISLTQQWLPTEWLNGDWMNGSGWWWYYFPSRKRNLEWERRDSWNRKPSWGTFRTEPKVLVSRRRLLTNSTERHPLLFPFLSSSLCSHYCLHQLADLDVRVVKVSDGGITWIPRLVTQKFCFYHPVNIRGRRRRGSGGGSSDRSLTGTLVLWPVIFFFFSCSFAGNGQRLDQVDDNGFDRRKGYGSIAGRALEM